MSLLTALRIAVLVGLVAAFQPASATAQTCTFTLTSSAGGTISHYGGTISVSVSRNLPTCSWTAAASGGSVTMFQPPTGDGGFTVFVPPNETPFSRIISVSFSGDDDFVRHLAFIQDARPAFCTYTLPVSLPAVSAEGSTIRIRVFTASTSGGIDCPWIAVSDAPWITVADGRGIGAGFFEITVAPHYGAYPRRGGVRAGPTGTEAFLDIGQAAAQPTRNVEIGGTPGADAVLYDAASGRIDIISLGVDSEGLSARDTLLTATLNPGAQIGAGDFDADGLTDLLVCMPDSGNCAAHFGRRASMSVYVGSSGGSGPSGASATILDANGDGRSDVFLYDPTSGAWVLKIATEIDNLGRFCVDGPTGVWASGWQVSAARFNDDRNDDLFLYNADPKHPYAGMWFRVLIHDDLTFEYVPGPSLWSGGWTVVPGDFDGDGLTELFLHGYADLGYWYIVDFRGDEVVYLGGRWAPGWQVYPADFNGDDRMDLLLYQGGPGPLAGYWGRALSNGAFDFDLVPGDMRWAEGMRVSIGDLDADGLSDVFIDGRSDGVAAQVLTRDAGYGSLYAYETAWPIASTIILSRTIVP